MRRSTCAAIARVDHVDGAAQDLGRFPEWINAALRHIKLYQQSSLLGHVLPWAETTDHPDFPLCTDAVFDPCVANFRNGWVDLSDPDVLHSSGDAPRGRYCFDADWVPEEEMSTPLWNRLVRTKVAKAIWKDEDGMVLDADQERVLLVLEGLLGRLLIPLGQLDRYEVMLYLRGRGQTGKSTLFDVIEAIIGRMWCGWLTKASRDGPFKLQSCLHKRIALCRDATEKLDTMVDPTLFTQMVSGESINVSTLYNGEGWSGVWTAPMLWGGNDPLTYKDCGNRVGRRLVQVSWDSLVDDGDFITDMGREIIRDELPHVFLRLARQYKVLRTLVGKGRFRTVLQSLRDFQQAMAEESNPSISQLQHGNDEWAVKRVEGGFELLQTVKAAFGDDFSVDDAACKAIGLSYERKNLCNIGGTWHSAVAATCHEHHPGCEGTRDRKYCVGGIRLVRRAEQGELAGVGRRVISWSWPTVMGHPWVRSSCLGPGNILFLPPTSVRSDASFMVI